MKCEGNNFIEKIVIFNSIFWIFYVYFSSNYVIGIVVWFKGIIRVEK